MLASRRAFFGIRHTRQGALIRPPWALPEAAFVEACTRCSACVEVCPTGLLVKGDGGYPEAAFNPARASQICILCGDCAQRCPEPALHYLAESRPWSVQAVFAEACLAQRDVVCRTCGESCPASAIRFPPRLGGVARPVLDEAACTGCGACLADCPTAAIQMAPTLSTPSALRGAA